MKTGIKIFLATRPKTLVAIVSPILIAASTVQYRTGEFHFLWLGLAFLAALLIQIATNFYNDAIDGEEKRDTLKRLGPKRFSHEDPGFLNLLKILAFGSLVVAFGLGLLLTYKGGPVVLLVGVPALFLAYLYTGTRFSLSANGVADPFVIFYFGLIPVWLIHYIITGVYSMDAAIMGLQCGFLSNALLVINNLRDEAEDLQANKKTLVVRFGRKFGLYLLAVCLFSPYLIDFLWLNGVFFRAGLWTFMVLPFSTLIFYLVVKNEPSSKYNRFLAFTALNLLLFSLIFSIGVMSS